MLKKLLAGAAGGAMLLTAAIPAFAGVDIFNGAVVTNEIITGASTGLNTIAGGLIDGGLINSGNAGAAAEVTNVVNSNDVSHWFWDCDCDSVLIDNGAVVLNGVGTTADSGGNTIAGAIVSGGELNTGDAGAASVVTNIVNTNVVDDFWWPVL